MSHSLISIIDPESGLEDNTTGEKILAYLQEHVARNGYEYYDNVPTKKIKANCLIIILPGHGVDHTLSKCIRDAECGHIQFFSILTLQDLSLDDRNGPGYRDYIKEIREEFGQELFAISPETENLDTILQYVGLQLMLAYSLQATKIAVSQAVLLNDMMGNSKDTYHSNHVRLAQDRVIGSEKRRYGVKKALAMIQASIKIIDRGITSYTACSAESASLSAKLKAECAKHHHRSDYYGVPADEVIGDIFDLFQKLLAEVQNFKVVATPAFEKWKDSALLSLENPTYNMPLIGMFSSGKTSFFNSFLGNTPQGKPLFRTARTHNTALLCCFRYASSKESRVVFNYRRSITHELLWPGSRPAGIIVSPIAGIIKSIIQLNDSSVIVEITPASSKESESVFLPPGVKLNQKIKKGSRIERNDQITSSDSMTAFMKRLKRLDPSVKLGLKARMICSLFQFYKDGIIKNCSMKILYREVQLIEVDGNPTQFVEFKEMNLSQHDAAFDGYLKEIYDLANPQPGIRTGQENADLTAGNRSIPVQVSFKAEINSDSLVAGHDLGSDEDWTWFQGGLDESVSSIPGFAESDTAAYLIENAEIFLNNPMFQLTTLVDTPGLGSITELHDRITEEYTHKGESFIIFATLGKAAFQSVTSRILSLIKTVLKEKQIDAKDWPRRVFIVLNRFARQPGARTEEAIASNISEFENTVYRVFGRQAIGIYVVDLSPERLNRADFDLELHGKPSLKQLLIDLRRTIGVDILAEKIERVKTDLIRIWIAENKNIERELEMLESEDKDKEIGKYQRTAEYFSPGSEFENAIEILTNENIESLMELVEKFRRQLNEIRSKDDLEAFIDSGSSLLKGFNSERNGLHQEFRDELRSLAARGQSSLDAQTRYEFEINDIIEKIPVFPTEDFRQYAEKMHVNWPGKLASVFWPPNWGYDKRVRREIADNYLHPEKTDFISSVFDELLKTIINRSQGISNEIVLQLSERIASLSADNLTRSNRKKELAAKLVGLNQSEPMRDAMVDYFTQTTEQITEIVMER